MAKFNVDPMVVFPPTFNTYNIEDTLRSIQNDVAELRKSVSSIEMELLLQRAACLDNNFEGKKDM